VHCAVVAVLISHKKFILVRFILTSWAYWHQPFTSALMCSVVE